MDSRTFGVTTFGIGLCRTEGDSVFALKDDCLSLSAVALSSRSATGFEPERRSGLEAGGVSCLARFRRAAANDLFVGLPGMVGIGGRRFGVSMIGS